MIYNTTHHRDRICSLYTIWSSVSTNPKCTHEVCHTVNQYTKILILPLTPAPSTNTSVLHSLAGMVLQERTNRNPRCWKKCLRKENLANRDDSAPVDAQDPPFIQGFTQGDWCMCLEVVEWGKKNRVSKW